MAPLFSSIVTLKSVSAKPPVTCTCSSHLLLSPPTVLTDSVVTTVPTLDTRPKSDTATPVTGLSKLAVNVMTGSMTIVPDAP